MKRYIALLTAVIEKRLGLNLSASDVFINVVGGLKIDEPSSDLAACIAIISGYRDIIVDDKTIAIGEIGLAGECRAVGSIENRVREAVRLGFETIIIPMRNYERAKNKLEQLKGKSRIIPVRSLFDCLKAFKNDNE